MSYVINVLTCLISAKVMPTKVAQYFHVLVKKMKIEKESREEIGIKIQILIQNLLIKTSAI